ncbi:MAG: hypothetical protein V1799_07885 [bacterium]
MEREQIILKGKEKIFISTPNGGVTVMTGLTDHRGRSVDSFVVTPTCEVGEGIVVRRGLHNTRLVRLKKVQQ